MKFPKIKTKVIHSRSKPAWNVVGETLGGKFKIARVPYITTENADINRRERLEAFEHPEFISKCFNKSNEICKMLNL